MSTLSEDQDRRHKWLAKFGFREDPFFLYEAEAEQACDLLPYVFVDQPHIDAIFGDPARPRPGILFAARGAGKTATRNIVAHRCNPGNPGRRALPVHYDDFSLVLREADGIPSRITIEAHTRAILRALIKTLPDVVPPGYWTSIPRTDCPLLMACVNDFGHPLVRGKLAELIDSEPLTMSWHDLAPGEILGELIRILTQLQPPPGEAPHLREARRFRALYILVDRVDESAMGLEGATALLQPLVSDRRLIDTPGVAFKFFLPIEIRQQLQQSIDLRPDRVRVDTIAWEAEALRHMLDRRVQYYTDDKLGSFGELCLDTTRAHALTRLIEAAEGSPRTLIRLCDEVVTQVAAADTPLIQPEQIGRAIVELRRKLGFLHPLRIPPIAKSEDTADRSCEAPPSKPLTIPSAYLKRVHHTLLNCAPVSSNRALRNVFVDPRIAPWRLRFPEADNPYDRADSVIAYLLEHYDCQGSNALALLLQALADRLDPVDACYSELRRLAQELLTGHFRE